METLSNEGQEFAVSGITLFFMILGSYLIISTIGWTLWFGILFMTMANNLGQKIRNDERYEKYYEI